MTIEEMVDYVQMDLTMSCALPKVLPDMEIRRLIIKDALPWFYENYQFAVMNSYHYIPSSTLHTDEFTQYKYITLPDEIQNVIWLYQTNDTRLFTLGFGTGAGQGAVNIGLTNQPQMSSYLSTIGELGVYKVVIDNFADALNQLTKSTLKFDYNFAAKRLHILTSVDANLIAETYTKVPAEDMFEMNKFKRYALALSKLQMGRMLTRFDFNLPGGVKINGEAVKTEGQEELDKVKEEIKSLPNTSFFFMVKR